MSAWVRGAAAALVGVAILTGPRLVASQEEAAARRAQPAQPAKPSPRLPSGVPDFSGVWSGGGGFNPRNVKPGDAIELLPAAKKLFDSRQGKWADDPEAQCLPTGVPRMAPYPWRMVQSVDNKYVFILFEGNIHSYRQVFLDGRKHPKDPDPTWFGHSIGWWEGDTLVVDTIGYNDKFWFSAAGWPHTTQLHTVERFTRTDFNTLSWEITVDDPGAYAKPFTLQTRARLEPTWDLMEYICQENNTNVTSQ